MAGRKIFYRVGGRGLKPDTGFRSAAPGKFTKGRRNKKPILGNQTRVNYDITNNTLRTLTGEEQKLLAMA